ncbi:MAG: hypothetical protein AAF604_15540 [Acidobacteriota bacterium]
MTRRHTPAPDALERWLAHEAADRRGQADEAFFEVFAALPMLAPPPGFTDRVLAAAVPRRVRWHLPLVACLVLLGLGTGLLPAVLKQVSTRVTLAGVVDGFSALVVSMARWVASAVDLWEAAAGFSSAIVALTEAPPVAAALVAMLVLAAVALRMLATLIANERSWSHVGTA